MKEYKEILRAIALNPFHPIYNLSENKYTLHTDNNYLGERRVEFMKMEGFQTELLPIFEISEEAFDCFTLVSDNTLIGKLDSYKELQFDGDLLLSYLVSVATKKENSCWWIDNLIEEKLFSKTEEEVLIELLSLQEKYRTLLMKLNPYIMTYIPYHWAELALAGVNFKGGEVIFVDELLLPNNLNENIKLIIDYEFNSFKKSIDKKKLSKIHRELILKLLILLKENGEVKFGNPFPFDTKGKKIEKVSMKVIERHPEV